ncbi:MAG: glycosyltransferase family 39 protein [Acidobacteria bacterium]|nr:glycosyltransferase family 39 protein [Acidobacteriota bacterium]
MAEPGNVAAYDGGRRAPSLLYGACALLLFAAFAFQLRHHAVSTSPVVDEGAHILAGHRHWQCGDFGINPEHPPLLKLVAAAPLNFRAWDEPGWVCGSRLTPKPEMFAAGTSFLVRNGVDRVTTQTRLAAAVLSMLLAALVFLAAREMFGRWEGLTALALLAFEPSLIAHGSLVTTDMALAATAFAAAYALYRYRKHPTPARLALFGAALGLMLAAKHSAVLFLPALFAALVADVALFRPGGGGAARRLAGQVAAFAAASLLGLAVLWAFYGFRYYSIPGATAGTISVADYIRENGRPEMIQSLPAKLVEAASRARVLPESYVLGLADVIAWGSRNSYILGKSYPTGQWWYFPLALAVKSSVALLALLPTGLLLPFFDRVRRRETLFLLAPPLMFFAAAMASPMTTGIRHVLPVYGFFVVAAAAGAVWLCRRFRPLRLALAALLVYHAAAAVRVAPNYLAFSNDLWGGVDNTRRIFNDSNVDFGQSVKQAAEYLAREGVTDCWFAAYNHRELVRATQPCRVLPSALRILVSPTVIEPVPPVIEGTVLVSVNELPPRGAGEYVPLTRSEPVALIGGNTLVYRGRFEVPLAAAMSHAYRSGQFLRAGGVAEAVAEGRAAVGLGGGDPRTHLALGLALARAGQKEEARGEFGAAAEMAARDPVFRNAEVRARQELERLR